MLTAKQQKFCENIALKGMTQTDAYKDAYPASVSWKPESVHEKASFVAGTVKVKSRIDELKKELEQQTIDEITYERKDSFKVFEENIKELNVQIKAVKEDKTMSTKEKAYLLNALFKNRKEQEEQKAKLYSLFVDRKEIKIDTLEDILDKIQ